MNRKDTETDTETDTEQPKSSRSKQTSTYHGPSVGLQGWVPPYYLLRVIYLNESQSNRGR